MKLTLAFVCLILSFSFSARAEYRAFLLQVKDSAGVVTRTFKSSLDPDQYRAFYPLKNGESLSYTDTWMCYGRTDQFQPICPSPHEDVGNSERLPASVPGK